MEDEPTSGDKRHIASLLKQLNLINDQIDGWKQHIGNIKKDIKNANKKKLKIKKEIRITCKKTGMDLPDMK